MIECPWCANQVRLVDHICPACRHEVLPEHLAKAPKIAADELLQEASGGQASAEDGAAEGDWRRSAAESWAADEAAHAEGSLEEQIANRFRCAKCGGLDCHMKEVAMSGTGLSKLLDIDYNHYLFVSCLQCGFVEVYNPDVLRGYRSGKLGTVLDLLFGR